MSFSDVVISAVVAAIVSLITAIVTYLANRRALAIEREKFERQLQRALTEKLYDLRLASYPKALHITEGLRRSQLWREDEPLTQQHLKHVLAEIDEWHSTQAAFLLSSNAMETLYALRRALRMKPEADGHYTDQQLQRVWDAKGSFRKALRDDIILLYGEELGQQRREE